MNAAARLAAFGLGLVAVFGAALGVGRLAGPLGGPVGPAVAAAPAQGAAAPADPPGGLQVSERGYSLQLAAPTAPAGPSALSFTVRAPDQRPVTAYQVSHEKELHLIVVRRDLTGYRHLHPSRDAAGTWTAPVDLRPGTHRVFADFQPAGEATGLTLGADLTVPGSVDPRHLPAPAAEFTVDGYAVSVNGTLAPGTVSRLSFAVRRGGHPVTDLQPYLGAAGHLVALRAGDLGYLHVHPTGDGLTFDVEVPSAGMYRLFLEFRHGGVVRTAEFTAAVRGGAPPPGPAPTGDEHGHGD